MSGYRVLPLSMRYASLALRRDMVRVGCYSSGISSLAAIEWPGWFKWKGTAAVAFLWSGLFVVTLWSMFTERAFSFTYLNHGKTSYTITNTGETRQIKHHITCDSTNLTFMIQWKRCKKQYIDETKCTLHERFKEHRQATNNPLHANATAAIPSHFNQPGHSITDMELIPLELQPTLSMSHHKARD